MTAQDHKAATRAALARFNAAPFGTAEYEAAKAAFWAAFEAKRDARRAEVSRA